MPKFTINYKTKIFGIHCKFLQYTTITIGIISDGKGVVK